MEVREMKNIDVERVRIGCCRCSEAVPEGEKVAACVCCGRFYCVRCIAAAMLFCKESGERVDAALAESTGRCMEELFAVIDRILLEEELASLPVPPRDQGH
jgi:hypothetical protein